MLLSLFVKIYLNSVFVLFFNYIFFISLDLYLTYLVVFLYTLPYRLSQCGKQIAIEIKWSLKVRKSTMLLLRKSNILSMYEILCCERESGESRVAGQGSSIDFLHTLWHKWWGSSFYCSDLYICYWCFAYSMTNWKET